MYVEIRDPRTNHPYLIDVEITRFNIDVSETEIEEVTDIKVHGISSVADMFSEILLQRFKGANRPHTREGLFSKLREMNIHPAGCPQLVNQLSMATGVMV